MLAAGVALADAMRREGVYPGTPTSPFTPGYDLVGIVEEIGKDVPIEWKWRKAAALLDGIGAYTQYICLPIDEIVEVPSHVNPVEAVALVLNYVSAYQMLHRLAKVKSMDRILIHGAAGGVGSALMNLGKLANLSMLGTASTPKLEHIAKYESKPIDYKKEDFVARVLDEFPEGIDAVFDPIGGLNWKRSFQTLNKTGVFVGYGFTNILSDNVTDENKQLLLTTWQELLQTNRTPNGNLALIYSLTTLKQKNPAWFKQDLEYLFKLLAKQKISPTISQCFPLKEVQKAHRFLENSHNVGKIVLICDETD